MPERPPLAFAIAGLRGATAGAAGASGAAAAFGVRPTAGIDDCENLPWAAPGRAGVMDGKRPDAVRGAALSGIAGRCVSARDPSNELSMFPNPLLGNLSSDIAVLLVDGK